jgi:hypothetical protein
VATPFVLTNALVLAGGYDLTSTSNEVAIQHNVDQKDVTDFASGAFHEYIGGLRSGQIDVKGFWTAGDNMSSDDFASANLGLSGTMVSVSPTGADGSLVYGMESMQSQYQTFTKVGEVIPFDAMFLNRGSARGLARGTILYPSSTATTTTGTGVARQVGAASSTQTIYTWLHVLSVSGTATPTLTVTVQRDNAVGFPSPVTVNTFTAATSGRDTVR